jgi:hypothetical protein
VAGDSEIEARGPALTVRVAVPWMDPSVPVTVWAPATVAPQLAPVQLPLGAMVKVVEPVTVPSELPYWSAPVAA